MYLLASADPRYCRRFYLDELPQEASSDPCQSLQQPCDQDKPPDLLLRLSGTAMVAQQSTRGKGDSLPLSEHQNRHVLLLSKNLVRKTFPQSGGNEAIEEQIESPRHLDPRYLR